MKKFAIANWKMNLNGQESAALAEEIASANWSTERTEVVVCPSFDCLKATAEKIKDSKVKLGSQDCFWEEKGAYTGAVSPVNLKAEGCEYTIIGHSERRQYLGETDEMVNKKVKAALAHGLIPIVCVGETFEERKEGEKDFVIMNQVNKALDGVKLLSDDFLIIAYEPVWVIGSGQAVEPIEAEHAHRVIRQILIDNFSLERTQDQTAIVYGGSINPENIEGFLAQPTVSGVLVGGASLEGGKFIELIKSCNSLID